MLVSGGPQQGQLVDLVIFDCDGVLIDSEVISTRATVAALAAVGYEIGEADAARRFVGRSWRSMRTEIEADWGKTAAVFFRSRCRTQLARGDGEIA